MEIITIDEFVFEIDNYSRYDSLSEIKISFESTPIGYMDRDIETVFKTIPDEDAFESFAREWIENRNSFR